MKLFSQLDSRLGTDAVWSASFARYAAGMLAGLTFIFDVAGLNSWSWLWLLVAAISFTESCLLIYLARRLFLVKRLKHNPSAWINVLVIAVVGAIHNLTDSTLSYALGIGVEPDLLYQVSAGAQMGFYILLFYGITVGSRQEHYRLLDELRQTTKQLQALSEESPKRLHAAEVQLEQDTRAAILPKLTELQRLLEGRLGKVSAVSEFRAVLNDHVRPFTRDLENRAFDLAGLADEFGSKQRTHPVSFLGQGMPFRDVILPASLTALVASSAWACAFVAMGQHEAAKIGLAALLNYPILWAIRLLLPKKWSTSDGTGSVLLILLGAVMSLAPLFAGFSDAHAGDPHWTLWVIPPILIVEILIVAEGIGLDHYRGRLRELLDRNNETLAHQLAIFEQKFWLAKRKWQYTVHGSVQSALTAALVRLSAASEASQETFDQVQRDVQRAIDALANPSLSTLDPEDAAEQLSASWEGVCEVSVTFAPGTLDLMHANPDAAVCVNEIMKEVVTNAVRYSQTQSLKFKVSGRDGTALVLESLSDSKVVVPETGRGLGARLLDELTSDWKVRNIAAGLVSFQATIPIA